MAGRSGNALKPAVAGRTGTVFKSASSSVLQPLRGSAHDTDVSGSVIKSQSSGALHHHHHHDGASHHHHHHDDSLHHHHLHHRHHHHHRHHSPPHEEMDPLQAVLKRSWNRVGQAHKHGHGHGHGHGRGHGHGHNGHDGHHFHGHDGHRARHGHDGHHVAHDVHHAGHDAHHARHGHDAHHARTSMGHTGNTFRLHHGDGSPPLSPHGQRQSYGGSPPLSPHSPHGRRAPAGRAHSPHSPHGPSHADEIDNKTLHRKQTRRYSFEICPTEKHSPRLRSPPMNRKGQVKLSYEFEAKQMDAEHGQSEVDDHMPHLDAEQEHFIDLCHKLEPLIDQAGVRLINMLTAIRAHFLLDKSWLEKKSNYDQLAELAFEVQTANYFLTKWHVQLEPGKVPAPTRPSKIDDMPAEDILAQALTSVSRMEVLASKLAPVLLKICHDARTLRRGPFGEPLTPTSKNAVTLAKKHGFNDVDGLGRMMGHLEHMLSEALHLSNPPKSGLPEKRFQAATNKIMAINAFSSLRTGNRSATKSAINTAFKSIGSSVINSASAGKEG